MQIASTYSPQLEDGTVDLVCADILRHYPVPLGSVLDLQAMWHELYRIAKPTAAIVLFSAQPFTSVLVASKLTRLESGMGMGKRKCHGLSECQKQPLRAHENIEVFTTVSRPTTRR